MNGDPPRVFISYSHDSAEHADRVLGLANRLRSQGIDAALDQYETSPPEGWPRWMDRQIDESDFVLMICTETYYRRVMDREDAGRGLGVRWEGNLIYQHIFDAATSNQKFIPLLVEGAKPAYIPRPVRGATYYFIDNESGYEDLYRRLTHQPKTIRPELGQLRQIASRQRKWRETPEEADTVNIQGAKIEGHHNIIVQAAGDGIHVDINRPHLALSRRHALQRPLTSKLDLLNPFRRAVPLVGRENDLAELDSWSQSEKRIAARCLIGRPYSGKTRLAVEFCTVVEQQGWHVGFIDHDELVRFLQQENLREWEWSAPTLIVLDNASTAARILRQWLVQLSSNSGGGERPLRVLLLDRHADPKLGWWPGIVTPMSWHEDGLDDLFDPPDPVSLLGALTSENRRDILTSVMAEACKLTGRPEILCPPAPGIDADFDRALASPTLQFEPFCLWLAAISAVEHGLPDLLHWNCTDIAEQLAMHEIGRIRALAEDQGHDGHLLTHIAACVTLSQGCRADRLDDLITEEVEAQRWTGVAIPSLARTIKDAMPLGEDDVVRPSVPEFIRGALVTTALRECAREQQASTMRRAYERAPVQVLSTVIRTAQDFGSSRDHPSLHWLDTIIASASNSRQLIEICDQLPDRTINLLDRAATAQALAVAKLRDELASGKEGVCQLQLARNLTELAYRYGDLGRLDEALAAVEEAVNIYRPLKNVDSDRAVPGLALALNCLANRRSKLGRRDEALVAAEEAVTLVRWLAENRSSGFQFELVQSITDLATHLSALGRRSEALRCAEEAAAMYRELAAARPDAFRLQLAISLTNLAYHRSALGKLEAALAASEESIAMLRELTAANPDSSRACLAHAANAVAVHLSAVGRAGDALAAAEESVNILQELAVGHMEAYGSDLVLSLNTLAGRLSQVGRSDEALEASSRAVNISRELCDRSPKVFCCDLAISLNNSAVLLAAVGRNQQALDAAAETLTIQRKLAAQWPDRFLPDLAATLGNSAARLSEAGRRQDALDAASEAVTIRRQLATKWPALFDAALARSVAVFESLSAMAGSREEKRIDGDPITAPREADARLTRVESSCVK